MKTLSIDGVAVISIPAEIAQTLLTLASQQGAPGELTRQVVMDLHRPERHFLGIHEGNEYVVEAARCDLDFSVRFQQIRELKRDSRYGQDWQPQG